jgi:DNA-binding GntR family transcriptional regulator
VNHRAASTARAYAFIRNKILDATYASGTILSANALARQIGVSRTPVQDALQRLQLDGLVTIRAKIGATFKFMNLPDFKELCWMRLILESNAAGLAATEHTTNDLAEITHAQTEMAELVASVSRSKLNESNLPVAGELTQADIRFHVAVMNASRNSLLKAEIVRLRLINRVVGGITPRYLEDAPKYGTEMRKTLLEHQRIRDAIAARDPEEATRMMAAHIQDILDHSIKRMRNDHHSRTLPLAVA